jgi:signal peptidase II
LLAVENRYRRRPETSRTVRPLRGRNGRALNMEPRRRLLWSAACAFLLAADWTTKRWALSWLAYNGPVPLARFFHLTYVENPGASFGMFSGRNWIFIPVTLCMLGALYHWRGYLARHGRAGVLGSVLVALGALGNLYDRAVYGFVVDFLDFRVWPVFYLADSYICVGGALLGWAFCFRNPDAGKPARAQSAAEAS